MSVLWQDVKWAVRMLRRWRASTLVAVLTLALGIGANTAIFSAVNGILLRALPLGQPERLVLFDGHATEGRSSGEPADGVWRLFSFPSYRHFTQQVSAFQDLAAFNSGEDRLSVVGEGHGDGAVQLAWGHLVSGNFFSVLRASPMLGRALAPGDDEHGAPPATVISHGYWRQRWGGDSSVVGRTVSLNGQPFTIVGVMPLSFFGLRVREPPDFWIPLSFQPGIERRPSVLAERDLYWLNLVGRLAPGADLNQAQAQVNVALRQLLIAEAGSQPTPAYRRAIDRATVRLAPGARGISGLREAYAEPLRVLIVVAAFVLLIACANIANLLLSRAAARRSEITMRLALGAGRWRLARQLLTESLVLAVLGGAAGLGLAQWGAHALKALVSPSDPVDIGMRFPVLLYTTGVTLAAGILFGLAPAWRAGRGDLATAIRSRTEAGGGRLRRGFAPALVVSQVALSLMLLVGSTLLVRSLINLARQDVGFVRQGVLLVDLDLRISGLDSTEMAGYYRRLLERVNALPGVRAATVASYSPMSGSRSTGNVSVEGFTPPTGEEMMVDVNLVGPRYGEVLGLSLIRGRDVDERDGPGTAPVAIVNEAFVRSFFAGENPLGRRFRAGSNPARPSIEIVGVVGDAKFQGPKQAPVRMVFLPLLQSHGQALYAGGLEVRTTGDPTRLFAAVRAAVTEVDPRVPVARVTTLDALVRDMVGTERLLARLVSAFGALAVLLACVGLYGVVSQAVGRRTNEIGIRIALGARREEILRMVLRESGALIVAGIGIGVPGALLTARLLRHQLFGVGAADPIAMAASVMLMVAVALVAGFIPARRASRVEPMVALRSE